VAYVKRGPKAPSEEHRREAPERRTQTGMGSGERRRSLSPVWVSGGYSIRIFLINVEIAYFSAVLHAEMVSSAVAQGRIRQ